LVTATEKPDVALIMNVANGFYLPALRVRKVPVVLNVDGIEWERAKWSKTGRRVFRLGAVSAARWADHLIADSVAIADYWRKAFGRESVFIPYGGDSKDAAPEIRRVTELGLDPGRYALIVARLVPENNVEQMLAGARAANVATVVVGSGGPELESRIRAQHNPPNVHILGHVADQDLLASLWAYSGVYLHGHSVGGTNPALVQAMGYGAPVLAFDSLYNREVLVKDEMLLPLDTEKIGNAARELLASPERRSASSDWGRRRVAEVYNWEAVCGAYESTLLRAVAGRGRRDNPAR
jgi:glycosyltransferase involved in cell wall biosynthesis